MKYRKFSVLGGDQRNRFLARLLAADGNEVNVFGMDESDDLPGIHYRDVLEEAILDCDVLIGPIPFSHAGNVLNCPMCKNSVDIPAMVKTLCKEKKPDKEIILFGGAFKDAEKALFTQNEIRGIDLLDAEELAVLNAIPTAEGAIQIAMEHTQETIHGSNVLVLGFGRIGKVLANRLQALFANVTVSARNPQALSWIDASGYLATETENIKECVQTFDLIFNTIPALVIDREVLVKIRRDCLVVDLASKPGGVDYAYAERIGANTIHALSLPGKVAPMTSAKYVKRVLYDFLERMGK